MVESRQTKQNYQPFDPAATERTTTFYIYTIICSYHYTCHNRCFMSLTHLYTPRNKKR